MYFMFDVGITVVTNNLLELCVITFLIPKV